MSDSLRRQVQQRLKSLEAAGIELLPRCDGSPPAFFANAANDAASASGEVNGGHSSGLEQRRIELETLRVRVSACTRCGELSSTRTQTVFGVGAWDPELCFIGEAPGADEDRQGEPFVGAAGQLLNRIITAMGMKREEVYICNILRCRPPGNRTPRSDEAANCREYLEAQLELIRPKHLCALGLTAARHLLGVTQSLREMRGKFFQYKDIPVMVTYHPAFLLPNRSPEKKKDVWEDMKLLLTRMGRPIPASGGGKTGT